jgi:hypothetical protein
MSKPLAFLSPRHCIVDIVVNGLVSNHATLQVEEATLVDGKKGQLMIEPIGSISARVVTILSGESSKGWKNGMTQRKGSTSGIGFLRRNSSIISLYSLQVYIHFCFWSRDNDSLSSADFVSLSRYANKKYFFPTHFVMIWSCCCVMIN